MRAIEEFHNLYRRDDTALIYDSAKTSGRRLSDSVSALRRKLVNASAKRCAVDGIPLESFVCTVIAAAQADIDVVLLREGIDSSRQLLEGLHVDTVVHNDLTTERLGHARVDCYGGHLLICTSGTTGSPKVARHRLAGLLARVRPPRGGVTGWLLTYHPASFAGLQVTLTALAGGAKLVGASDTGISGLAALAIDAQVSHISGTPTFWRAFISSLGPRTLKVPVKQITLGGEAVDQSTLDLVHRAYPGAKVSHIYASTEAGALFAVHDGRAGFPSDWLDKDNDGVELRVKHGVLEARSDRSMVNYALAPPGSALRETDGWIATGDMVEVDGDRVRFCGRVDSTINLGGSKVSPERIEQYLAQVQGVRDIRVYGVKSPITGSVLAADVLPEAGFDADTIKQELGKFARENLERHMVPRVIKFVDEIKLNASGKKDRR